MKASSAVLLLLSGCAAEPTIHGTVEVMGGCTPREQWEWRQEVRHPDGSVTLYLEPKLVNVASGDECHVMVNGEWWAVGSYDYTRLAVGTPVGIAVR